MSRLNLNFNLSTREERVKFIEQYLSQINFKPTEAELEVIGSYILWGKSTSNEVEKPTDLGLKEWAPTHNVESLETLMESPLFNETSIRPTNAPVYKSPRLNFSRAAARAEAPAHIKEALESLWTQIDETELVCQEYELLHGRRTTPIRDTLKAVFTPDRLKALESKAAQLTPYQHLKLKHLLVELRREQYNLRDEYKPVVLVRQNHEVSFGGSGVELNALPLGLKEPGLLYKKLWRADRMPEPTDFDEDDLKAINKLVWSPKPTQNCIDFRDADHLYKLNNLRPTIEFQTDAAGAIDDQNTINLIFDTFDSYAALSELKDFQVDVLMWKRQGVNNTAIVELLEKKYGKRYTVNYISTLYCKTILGKIAETAKHHQEVVENLWCEENFKTCLDCGRSLLRTDWNFVRKAKSKDGYSPRCKRCEKILRDRRLGKK